MPKVPEGSAMRYTIDRASWLVGRAAVEHPMEGDDGCDYPYDHLTWWIGQLAAFGIVTRQSILKAPYFNEL